MTLACQTEIYCEPKHLALFRSRFWRCDNLALRFHRFVRFDFSKWDEPRVDRKWLRRMQGPVPNHICVRQQTIQEELLADIESGGLAVGGFRGQSGERLAVGMGNAHVLENSLSFAHIHGLPYLPGSGVKGVARAWAVKEILCPGEWTGNLDCFDRLIEAEGVETMLEKNDLAGLRQVSAVHTQSGVQRIDNNTLTLLLNDPDWKCNLCIARRIFGRLGLAGEVIFLDAFPASASMEADVMAPHYGNYYRSNENWPVDSENPSPILFAVIAGGAVFHFRLAAPDEMQLLHAVDWLKKGLQYFGVGAKTSVGYGRFDTFSTLPAAGSQDLQHSSGLEADPKSATVLKTAFADQNPEKAWPWLEEYVLQLRRSYETGVLEELDNAFSHRLKYFKFDEISAHRLNVLIEEFLPKLLDRRQKRKIAMAITGKGLHKSPELSTLLPVLAACIPQDDYKSRIDDFEDELRERQDTASLKAVGKKAKDLDKNEGDRLEPSLYRRLKKIIERTSPRR
jgi:CRISPR-associated protein Cmr6